MKKTNYLNLFFKYVTLNILAMLGLSCYILADAFFVSKALEPNGLAALNLAIPIYSFINGAGLMLGIGGATKYSISKSQKNKIKSNNIFTQTILLGSFIALIFFIIGLFFSKNLTSILGADENIFNLEGNLGIASYSIIANISIVVMSIFTGLSQGIQPLISSYHGKNDKKAISKLLKYSFISLVSLSIIIYSFIFFKSSFIVNIFNNEKNVILQSIAENGLKIYFISCLFLGFNILMSIYFTSLEYTRPAHIISLLRGFIIIIPLAYILSNSFGIFGTWITFPNTEFIISIISFILYKKLKE